ncbi:hypothetical protein LguiB_021438 [Lonicera macranthoides]
MVVKVRERESGGHQRETVKGEAVSSIQVNVKESSQHVEANLSELKGYEKHVIVETNNRWRLILPQAEEEPGGGRWPAEDGGFG